MITSTVRTLPRPTSFDEYRGNETIKQVVLTALAQGNIGHITIEGPSGAGKTLLAKLIARALLCKSPLSDGTPCCACETCSKPLERLVDFKLVRCPTQGSAANIAEIVEIGGLRPLVARYRVIVFDEAQGLTLVAQEKLLGPLEAEGQRTIVIFTAISADALIFPLRTRTRRFTLEMPDFGQSMRYLADTARAEGIEIDADAMELIAAYSKGYRNLAENLAAAAAFAAGGLIDIGIVRSSLLRDKSQGMLAYLAAAAQGDYEAQVSTLGEMSLSANEKVEWLLAVLAHLGTRKVGPTLSTRESDNLNLLLADDDCQMVAGHFANLARMRGQTLHALFDEVLEFWLAVPAHLGETQLAGHVLRFQNLLWFNAASPGRVSDSPTASLAERRAVPVRKPVSWRSQVGPGLIDPHGPHLTLRQAFELYEPATFLAQAFGKGFNLCCTVDFAGSDRSDQENAAVVSAMLKQMRARFFERAAKDQGPAADLHRIAFYERVVGAGFRSMVLIHAPAALAANLSDFFDRFARRNPEIKALHHEAQFPDRIPAVLSYHWALMRKLWAGIDPSEQLGSLPAIERLRIKPSDTRKIGPIGCRRYSISGEIGDQARHKAMMARLGHLSAWNDGAWAHLFRGWEGPEHTARTSEESARKQRVEEIERSYSMGQSLEQSALHAALAHERAMWPVDPHHRKRTWKGQWWQPEAKG